MSLASVTFLINLLPQTKTCLSVPLSLKIQSLVFGCLISSHRDLEYLCDWILIKQDFDHLEILEEFLFEISIVKQVQEEVSG